MTTLNSKSKTFHASLTMVAFSALVGLGGTAHAQTAATTPAKPTVPQSPKADYAVKDLAKKNTPLNTPLAMTETYTAVVQDKEKAANSKNVGVISRNTETTTTTTTATAPVVTVSNTAQNLNPTAATPAGNAQVAAQPSVANTVSSTTTTTTVSEKKPFDEKTITANVKPAEKSIKQMNEINARLAEVELLQKLKEAEFKLQQPIEDKDKKSTDKSASSTGTFDPVIRGGGRGAGAGLPTGAPALLPVAPSSTINVYSVVGFDGDYTAKINVDGKSTYTVKKGDALPDGQVVVDVTRYYIAVSERSVVGRPVTTQRIYVTGKPLNNTPARGSSVTAGAASSSSPQAQAVGSMVGGMPAGGSNLVVPGQGTISSARTVR